MYISTSQLNICIFLVELLQNKSMIGNDWHCIPMVNGNSLTDSPLPGFCFISSYWHYCRLMSSASLQMCFNLPNIFLQLYLYFKGLRPVFPCFVLWWLTLTLTSHTVLPQTHACTRILLVLHTTLYHQVVWLNFTWRVRHDYIILFILSFFIHTNYMHVHVHIVQTLYHPTSKLCFWTCLAGCVCDPSKCFAGYLIWLILVTPF